MLPAILHWDMNHFVLLTAVRKTRGALQFEIADPAAGINWLSEDRLSTHFTGVALEITPHERFRYQPELPSLKLQQLWTKIVGIWPALLRLFALSAIVQLVAIITPFHLQLTVDRIVPAKDNDLAHALLVGFAGLLLISSATSLLRGWLAIRVSTTISLQMASNLFRHTIFLPVTWFERRHLGDVISRFGSLQPITDLISKGIVATAIDGLLGCATHRHDGDLLAIACGHQSGGSATLCASSHCVFSISKARKRQRSFNASD
jgi:ATP-binding cassette subfamily B protein RaxB